MEKIVRSFIIGFSVALILLLPLHAQEAVPPPPAATPYQPPAPKPDANPVPVATPSPPPAPINNPSVADTTVSAVDTNTAPASTPPAGQAPDEVIKKLSDLARAGKYPEAQQLAAGLLLAYPDDQRLIKAKAILDKLVAAPSPTDTTPSDNQSANRIAQPAANGTSVQLTGMDKVQYNSLIEMATEAQQNTDLDQQKASLKRFMDESGTFLQKHPDQMTLWEFRVAAALILDDPDAGYEAGQKLLAAGAADSSDPNLQQLVSKLNIKGWLDKQKLEGYKNCDWVLGTWSVSSSDYDSGQQENSDFKEIFSKSASGEIEGYYFTPNVKIIQYPDMRGTVLGAGEIGWRRYLLKIASKNNKKMDTEAPPTWAFTVNQVDGKPLYPAGWQPPISCAISDDKRTMTMIFPRQGPNPNYAPAMLHPVTLVFEKISDSQGQPQQSMQDRPQSQQGQPQDQPSPARGGLQSLFGK